MAHAWLITIPEFLIILNSKVRLQVQNKVHHQVYFLVQNQMIFAK